LAGHLANKQSGGNNMKAYLANGLFNEADQAYNEYLAHRIRMSFPWVDLYVPQENEALNDKTGYADSRTIFKGDNKYLDEADILIAVLDGIEIDSGVSAEAGRFIAFKEFEESLNEDDNFVYAPRYIFGLYTDVRQQGADNAKKIDALINQLAENQFMYRNLYVVGGIKEHGVIASSSDELIGLMEATIPFPKK
jgi:nucleoside 2-deoxyribosyltransferase